MKKADKYILLGVFILIILSLSLVFVYKRNNSSNSTRAIISQDGKVIRAIDLSAVDEAYEFTVESKNNGSNTIYVEKNKIKFSQANCPDKLCVKTGFLAYNNDIAVCLPHGIVIEIEDGQDGQIDSLAN